jgi:hypothetical protein
MISVDSDSLCSKKMDRHGYHKGRNKERMEERMKEGTK